MYSKLFIPVRCEPTSDGAVLISSQTDGSGQRDTTAHHTGYFRLYPFKGITPEIYTPYTLNPYPYKGITVN